MSMINQKEKGKYFSDKVCIAVIFYITAFSGCLDASKPTNVIKSKIIDGNLEVSGVFKEDSIYDGIMTFTDLRNNTVLSKTTFKEGVRNGISTEYYRNGKVKLLASYVNGEITGEAEYFDSLGFINYSQDYFYGIPVGGQVLYSLGLVNRYNYFNFEGELIFTLNYDSIKGAKIVDLSPEVFQFKIFDKMPISELNGNDTYIRIYELKPPKYLFEYSIIEIDSLNSVGKKIGPTYSNGIYSLFEVNSMQSKRVQEKWLSASIYMIPSMI